MHNYNYVNTLWFGTVSFDSCSRFILCLICFGYYVYDNPTYEVANKLICILYLGSGVLRSSWWTRVAAVFFSRPSSTFGRVVYPNRIDQSMMGISFKQPHRAPFLESGYEYVSTVPFVGQATVQRTAYTSIKIYVWP